MAPNVQFSVKFFFYLNTQFVRTVNASVHAPLGLVGSVKSTNIKIVDQLESHHAN